MLSTRFLPRDAAVRSVDYPAMSKTARPEAYTSLQGGIGERIGWAREMVGLKQSELARMIGTDPSTISHIEGGKKPPSIFNVIEIANRLKVSTDYILRGLLTAQTDQEMALKLAAVHPELVLRLSRTAEDMGTALVSDRH